MITLFSGFYSNHLYNMNREFLTTEERMRSSPIITKFITDLIHEHYYEEHALGGLIIDYFSMNYTMTF